MRYFFPIVTAATYLPGGSAPIARGLDLDDDDEADPPDVPLARGAGGHPITRLSCLRRHMESGCEVRALFEVCCPGRCPGVTSLGS